MPSAADNSSEKTAPLSDDPGLPVAPEANKSDLPPDLEDKKVKAVIVVGGMTVPKAAVTIVVEARTYSTDADGNVTGVKVKRDHYPTGADIYLRYDEETSFPSSAQEVLTMGDNVEQHNFAGFTRLAGRLNVGPAHPAYAAANLAWQRGANVIEIVGLTKAEQEKLRPYFDGLETAAEPAQVTVSFS